MLRHILEKLRKEQQGVAVTELFKYCIDSKINKTSSAALLKRFIFECRQVI